MTDFVEIIQDSLDSLAEKKQWTHDYGTTLKAAAKDANLDPAVLRRVADYEYYSGKAWEGSPLSLDKESKVKDKISPAFIKLRTIIDDLAQLDKLDLLTEYIDALGDLGIHISFKNYLPIAKTTNKERTDDAINSALAIKENILELSDKIKDVDSDEAEQHGFGPKKEYLKLINLAYNKDRRGKDIDDKCQEAVTNLDLAMKSYEYIQHN